MTFALLAEIFRKNCIPDSVRLMSDSGWECDATDMDGIYYNSSMNVIVFTQGSHVVSYCDPDWKCLYDLPSSAAGSNSP